MPRLPPFLRIPAAAVAATVLAFPFLSISIPANSDTAHLSFRALLAGAVVLALGYGSLLVRTAWRAAAGPVARVSGLLRERRVRLGGLLLVLAFAAAFPFVMSRSMVSLGTQTLTYAILAVGLNVVVGYAGLLVLGYAGFWAIGGYTFALLALHHGWNLWLTLPVAGLAAMFAGLLIGLPSLRLRGDYLAIVTLGFGETVFYLLKTQVDLTGGEMGLPNKDVRGDLQAFTSFPGVGPLTEPSQWYWPTLICLAAAVLVIRRVERSRVGRAMIAMREDETAARCMGVNTTRLKLAAFAFSAMWAGIAGVLWVGRENFVNPKYFEFMQSVIILSMVVLGGMGSILGSIVGAILLVAGPALMREAWSDMQHYRLLLFGAILVLLMVYRPQGLFGSKRLKVELRGEDRA